MSKELPKLLHVETSDVQLAFPPSHHLIITTNKNIYSWNSRGLSGLFRSGSEGIVAAKKAKDGSGMLAVADSQVVVLHDVKRGMERSYRLKGADGHVRLLRYTNDSKSLFFTTSLQNSVQSYSLKQSCLLDPSHEHPSPPTCLALSPTSHLLLSCSASPPTIYLQNLTLRTPPLNMRPSVSSAAVTVASFHPGRPNIFLLAFSDGMLAAYDATRLFRDGSKGEKRPGTIGRSVDGEIAHISNIHSLGTTATLIDPNETIRAAKLGGFEEEVQTGGVGNKAVGLTSAEFVPGFRARVISVGADGKCALVDFEGDGGRVGVVLKTWHVRAPATSLSILQVNDAGRTGGDIDSVVQRRRERSAGVNKGGDTGAGKPCLVAIGRVDGKAVVFNSSGVLLGEKTVDLDGGQVIGVEWAIETANEENQGKDKGAVISTKHRNKKQPPSIPARRLESRVPLGRRKRRSMSSILAAGRDVEEEILPDLNDTPEPGEVRSPWNNVEAIAKYDDEPLVERGAPKQSVWQDVIEPPAPEYMNLFSPIRQKARRRSSQTATLPLLKRRKSGAARVEELLAKEEGDARSTISAPSLAAEESPRKTGYLSVSQGSALGKTRRMPVRKAISHASQQSSKSPSRAVGENGKLLAEIRSARGSKTGSRGNGFALFAPYMPKRIAKEPVNSLPLQASSEKTPVPGDSPSPLGDIWLADATSNEGKGPRDKRKSVQNSSESASSTSTRIRKTVSFQPPTDIERDSQVSPTKPSPHRKLFIHNDVPEPKDYRSAPGPRPRDNSCEGPHNVAPLTEMSHNSCSPTKRPPSYTPRRRSSRVTTPLRLSKSSSQPHCCPSHSHLHEEVAKLHEEMRLFQTKMIREFQVQQRWFEEVVSGERKASEAVREENERLRRELFEVVRAGVGLGERRE